MDAGGPTSTASTTRGGRTRTSSGRWPRLALGLGFGTDCRPLPLSFYSSAGCRTRGDEPRGSLRPESTSSTCSLALRDDQEPMTGRLGGIGGDGRGPARDPRLKGATPLSVPCVGGGSRVRFDGGRGGLPSSLFQASAFQSPVCFCTLHPSSRGESRRNPSSEGSRFRFVLTRFWGKKRGREGVLGEVIPFDCGWRETGGGGVRRRDCLFTVLTVPVHPL